jgi:GTP-binding protein HflX
VFNKIDLLAATASTNGHSEGDEHDEPEAEQQHGPMSLEGLKASVMNHHATDTVFISAEKGLNMDALRELLLEKVSQIHYTIFPNYLKDQVFSGENGQQ